MSEPGKPFVVAARQLSRHFRAPASRLHHRGRNPVRAVDNVDLHIAPGESVGLVGESGCGKTTLSRLLLQLDAPTAGSVLVEGRDTRAMNRAMRQETRRLIQPVFQDPSAALNPRMAVGRIVSEPLRAMTDCSRTEILERVSGVLERVGLQPGDATRYPWQFSGGQKQRIAIARALVLEPNLLVLDEAVASQDVSIRAQILNLLQDIRSQSGVAYLFISHDLSTVRFLCDRIYVMYCGKIVEQGPTEAVCASPRHPYTKALFDAWLPPIPGATGSGARLSGEIPGALNRPPGCAFHPRCPQAMPICRQQDPPVKEIPPGRRVSCHLDQTT